ncbi:EamA family transporter RarD [Actinomadura madurae]|uniref:EamA family transporter RarD n=1 Tax=Actinomadura madurae TaxID=1993 RepID=UPI0020D22477|nr:EamA family transporter RarD [Actinomadura madurae]MCP9969643.1 EamA family transporter RarD [Actinomadura madurae]MCP9982098.1 EamA family transporter RarD [Actinomadura madurae]MCQ0006376.1 EamA family transporter RarD [Actinomadura madurae]
MAFGVAAYVMWGLFPLYWPLLKPAGAVEILAHRIMWSLVAVAAVLAVRRSWRWMRQLGLRQWVLLGLAAAVISVNWGTYIYAVNSGQTVEAALGYFINPLISVVFGVMVFHERLRPWQWTAVGLGTAAVVVLTVDYGRPPWIALMLAFAFGTYGLLKKFANMPSAQSLAVETAVMFVPALVFLLFLEGRGDAAFGHHGVGHAVLLVGAGVVTAVPLMLFNASAIRLPMTVIGMLQYLAPVLQFVIGVFIQHEEMPASRWAGFLLVWFALVTLTWDGLRAGRREAVPEAA